MTKYVPKRQRFQQYQIEARTALAVIDHSIGRERNQVVTKNGELQYRLVFPKATTKLVAKPRVVAKDYDWLKSNKTLGVHVLFLSSFNNPYISDI